MSARTLKIKKSYIKREQAMVKAMSEVLGKQIANGTKQLENYLAIQHYMIAGKKLPSFHDWPISPDFGLLLIDLIEEHEYDLVVEFGSGTSTVLIGQSINNVKLRTGKLIQYVVFEHLENYHAQTQNLLNAAGLESAVQLVHAPLVDYCAPNGKKYNYYSCQEELQQIESAILKREKLKILVVVDGPPAATGPLARYPALHQVWPLFHGASFHILMDDYNRKDEKDIVDHWVDELRNAQLNVKINRLPFEKEAAYLLVD